MMLSPIKTKKIVGFLSTLKEPVEGMRRKRGLGKRRTVKEKKKSQMVGQ